jgi:hypothetical protein
MQENVLKGTDRLHDGGVDGKMILRTQGMREWTDPSDRVQWRTHVNTVMDLQVL